MASFAGDKKELVRIAAGNSGKNVRLRRWCWRVNDSISFYFFDLDDNLFFMPTLLYLWNAVTQQEKAISSGQYATIGHLIGKGGGWEEWCVRPECFRDFQDVPDLPTEQQPFVKDLLATVNSGAEWQGPSWPLLVHAAKNQRPVAFITARGHAPETIQVGFDLLADRGVLPARLSFIGIYPVTHPGVKAVLGATDPGITVPSVKKMAIRAAVEAGIAKYGDKPAHRFGMSDDDPNNVMLAITAMRDCKVKYPDKRFFVINTNKEHYVKLEIFPMLHPVTAERQGVPLLSNNEG